MDPDQEGQAREIDKGRRLLEPLVINDQDRAGHAQAEEQSPGLGFPESGPGRGAGEVDDAQEVEEDDQKQ